MARIRSIYYMRLSVYDNPRSNTFRRCSRQRALSISNEESTHLGDTTGALGSPSCNLYWKTSYAANKTRKISKNHPSSQKATAGFEPGGAWLGIVSLTSAAAPRLFQKVARPECPTAIRRHNLCARIRVLWHPCDAPLAHP